MRLAELSTSKQKLIEQHRRQHKALMESVCVGLTPKQRYIVENIVKEFSPLVEYTLTQDQIQQLFGNVEKSATASGSNRTALGKSKDVVAAANRMINDAGRWLQDTTPVKAFDQKFEQLKRDLRDKLGATPQGRKVINLVDNLGEYAKENPKKTAFAIGILTAVSAIATGPVGGAIAGQVLRGSMELAKGEKLSTAIGKGLKTAAIGALAGLGVEEIGNALGDSLTQAAGDIWPNGEKFKASFRVTGINVPTTWQTVEVFGTPEQIEQVKDSWDQAVSAWRNQDYDAAEAGFEQARQAAEDALNSADTLVNDLARADAEEAINNALKVFDGLSAAAQGAASGATAFDDNGKPVQENINISRLFVTTAYLCEKQRTDEISLAGIKQQAAKIAQRGLKKAQDVGKDMTTRVTANKLMKAWEKAGSPTDSAEIAKFLSQQNVKSEIVTQAFKSSNLEVPPEPSADDQAQAGDDPKQSGDDQAQAAGDQSQAGDTSGPVDTVNNKFDGAVQKYLASKKLARGGLTYKLLPDILKSNNYAKPEQWIKNAGVVVKNPGQVVSKKDLEKLANYLSNHNGRMGKGEAPAPTNANEIDVNTLASNIKNQGPEFTKQIIQYLQQSTT